MSTTTNPEPGPAVETDRREQLRAELEATRDLYMELVSLTNTSNWNNQSGNKAWTVGQVMGHMVMIFGAIPWKIQRVRKGKGAPGLPKFLFDPLNAFSTRLSTRKYTPDNIAAAYDEAHQKALHALEDVGEHEWTLSASFFGVEQDIAEFFHYHASHVREHEPDVRAGL